MAGLNWEGMRESLLNKMSRFKRLVEDNQKQEEFWDCIVLTAGTESQRHVYQRQVQDKLKRKELPSCCRYLVISDPPGAKLGDGGATLHALDQLSSSSSDDYLKTAKVLLIHAGGYSQRLPSASVLGKVFLAYPINGEAYQMLDLLLIMLLDFPSRMRPGVYVGCSDLLLPCILSGEWTFEEAGFTGVAIPSEAELGTTHGVYVLEDPAAVRKQHQLEPAKTALMSSFKRFLHKVSKEVLQSQGAILPGTNTLFIDHSYFLDCRIASALLQFYRQIKPLCCEVDAFGDFLRPLGSQASLESILQLSQNAPNELVDIRKNLFEIMHKQPARVVVLQQASFVHFGTIMEYLTHFTDSEFMRTACLFTPEALVKETDTDQVKGQEVKGQDDSEHEGAPPSKKRKDFSSVVMVTVKDKRATIGTGSVVEFCTLEGNSRVEPSCIVSGLHLKSGLSVPDHSYLHTVAMEMDATVKYVTFALGVSDDIKASRPRQEAGQLMFCGQPLSDVLKKLDLQEDKLWAEDSAKCSLWTAILFPICNTRAHSAEMSIAMLRCIRGQPVDSNLMGQYRDSCRVSLEQMMKNSCSEEALSFVDQMFRTCRQ